MVRKADFRGVLKLIINKYKVAILNMLIFCSYFQGPDFQQATPSIRKLKVKQIKITTALCSEDLWLTDFNTPVNQWHNRANGDLFFSPIRTV